MLEDHNHHLNRINMNTSKMELRQKLSYNKEDTKGVNITDLETPTPEFKRLIYKRKSQKRTNLSELSISDLLQPNNTVDCYITSICLTDDDKWKIKWRMKSCSMSCDIEWYKMIFSSWGINDERYVRFRWKPRVVEYVIRQTTYLQRESEKQEKHCDHKLWWKCIKHAKFRRH